MAGKGVSRRGVLGSLAGFAGLAAIRCVPATRAGQDSLPPPIRVGGTLRVATTGELISLDPHGMTAAGQLATGPVYSRLLRPRNGVGYDSAEIVEDLAETWEQSDEITHIFYLRRGVRWHDIAPVSGRELVADDVKLSFERLAAMRPTPPWPAFAAIDRIELPDRYTVKVVLKDPQPSFLATVAQARIAPTEILDGDLRRIAIGTGPFILDKPAVAGKLTLRRNPSYYRPGMPYLDAIEVTIAPDRAAELALYKTGLADIGPEPIGWLPADGDAVRSANGDLQIPQVQRPTVTLLAFNTSRAPFNDVRLRKAVSFALDRRRVAADAYGDLVTLSGHLPPSIADTALPPEEVERLFGRRDLTRARQLWSETALNDTAELTLLVTPQADAALVAEHVVEQLREIGLRVRIVRPETLAVLNRMTIDRAFDLALIQPAASTEPDDWTSGLYGSMASRNSWGYVDRRFDELAARSRRGLDKDLRRKALTDVQVYLADKVPATPLFSPIHQYAISSALRGWSPHWTAGLPGIDEAWLARAPDPKP